VTIPGAARTGLFCRLRVFALLALATVSVGAQPVPNGPLLPRDSAEAAVFRGSLVYANYCVTCHGMNADGNGRAARLYDPRPANLRATEKNDAYLALIVRLGGEKLGRSQKMPPWGEELTDEQISDVVAYVRAATSAKR
jgi:mono/diheme cytochrome c family protein